MKKNLLKIWNITGFSFAFLAYLYSLDFPHEEIAH